MSFFILFRTITGTNRKIRLEPMIPPITEFVPFFHRKYTWLDRHRIGVFTIRTWLQGLHILWEGDTRYIVGFFIKGQLKGYKNVRNIRKRKLRYRVVFNRAVS
jgi:hypothetical protein